MGAPMMPMETLMGLDPIVGSKVRAVTGGRTARVDISLPVIKSIIDTCQI
jgi:hypothetical protein